MNGSEILYEAQFGHSARRYFWTLVVLLAAWVGVGVLLWWCAKRLWANLGWLPVFLLGSFAGVVGVVKMFRRRNHPGVYRISVDDYGFYVQCDDPARSPSFAVLATDLASLVHKTIKVSGDSSDEHEYYVQTKSGPRHRIDLFYANYSMDVMVVFEKVADRFHWVEIVEETGQKGRNPALPAPLASHTGQIGAKFRSYLEDPRSNRFIKCA